MSGEVWGLQFIAMAMGHGWGSPGHASMAAEGVQKG